MDHSEEHDDATDAGSDTKNSESGEAAPSERRAPGWVIHALIVFATVLGVVSGLNVWVERQLLDTDEWVEVADELLADDEVRGLLATYLVDELYESVDVAEELSSRLPEDLDGLGGLVAAALRDPATDGVNRLLETDLVRGLWSEVNETTHATLVRILKDETGPALSTTDGTVTLELGELVKQVGREFGLSLDVVDELPEDIGRVTLIESEELAAAQDAVRLIETLSVILFLVVLVLYAAAVYLAGQRRREAIREIGVALVISSVLVLVGLRIAAGAVEGAVGEASGAQGAARAVTEIGTELLRGIFMAGLIFGALIVGYAALAGPSKTATRLREMLVPVLLAKPIVAWSAATGAFLLVLYLVPSEPLQSWWRGLIFITLFVVAIEALRRQLAREFPEALSASAVPEDAVPEDAVSEEAVSEDAVPTGSDVSG
jgi:hypothetical protein